MRERIYPFERHATVILISGLMMLVLLGFARIYTVTSDLKRSQHDACVLRRQGRENTNIHDRVPLRAALKYLGDLAAGSAASRVDPATRAAATAFAARFHGYAKAVEPLPNPKC